MAARYWLIGSSVVNGRLLMSLPNLVFRGNARIDGYVVSVSLDRRGWRIDHRDRTDARAVLCPQSKRR
jgi:hypothetical protein